MTVGELIERLNKLDSTKTVYILTTDDNPLSGGYDIGDIFEITGSDTPGANAVFLCEC